MPEQRDETIEMAKLEFEKYKFAKQRRPLSVLLSIIAAPTVVAAIIAGISMRTVTVITNRLNTSRQRVADEMRTNEFNIAVAQNAAQLERLWKQELLRFLSEHRTELFTTDGKPPSEDILAMMDVVFPSPYVSHVLDKLKITTAMSEAGGVTPDKKRVLAELLGPVDEALAASEKAFEEYSKSNVEEQLEVMRSSNAKVRSLLTDKADLIPPELGRDAVRLVEHYVIWQDEYNRAKSSPVQTTQAAPGRAEFIFAGPRGFPFPSDAAQNFRKAYGQYKAQLAGDP